VLSPSVTAAEVEQVDLTGVKVGVYNGSGEMNSSRIALLRMFEWMGASVEEVNASQILGDYLDDCDIIVFPGGSESSYMIDLQYITGIEKIQNFVQNGGSYFGICGGSTFGAGAVNLFDGEMRLQSQPGETIHMTTMYTNQLCTGPDLSDCSANFTTMYYASQYFAPDYGMSVNVVATYQPGGTAGMIAFEYGNGTVFLSSPHPEYEENSDRDNTTFGDELDDPDSEWDLLLRVSKWLVEASPYEPSSSTTTTSPTSTPTTPTTTSPTETPTTTPSELPLTAVTAGGVFMVLLVVVVLYRKR
jgi:glutamine amidotransferase-like uncharacterized protein